MPMPHAELKRGSAAEAGLIPERVERLVAALQDEIDRKRLPGAVALISRHGKVALFESLGWQDPALQTPMTTDSVFRIYSMTKPITSVAIMMLYEEGKLLLTDPVGDSSPSLPSSRCCLLEMAAVAAVKVCVPPAARPPYTTCCATRRA